MCLWRLSENWKVDFEYSSTVGHFLAWEIKRTIFLYFPVFIGRGEWSGSEGLEREGRRWEGHVDKHRTEFPPVISLSSIWVSFHSRRLLTQVCQYRKETIHVYRITFPNPTIVCLTVPYPQALFLLSFPHVPSVCVLPPFINVLSLTE